MKTTVNETMFRDAFKTLRPDNFSPAGLSALWDYFEDYEFQTGEEVELDVIAICCDYTEYENLAGFQADYSGDFQSIEDIEDKTTVIRIADSDGFIIQNF